MYCLCINGSYTLCSARHNHDAHHKVTRPREQDFVHSCTFYSSEERPSVWVTCSLVPLSLYIASPCCLCFCPPLDLPQAIRTKTTLKHFQIPELTAKSTMRLNTLHTAVTIIFTLTPFAKADSISYGICQAGCASLAMACYVAAGFTWGTVFGATAPLNIRACNDAFGTSQAACAIVSRGSTP